MNVLLIDDDRFVVAALQKKIDWTSLSVSEIFSAYNIRQAKKIMEDNSIRICVCDIEMPGGSGLELLAWVREHDIDTEFIFLTSYADFEYAQKAIELSSLDYQLKPLDFGKLYEILLKAVSKVKKAEALNKTMMNSENWQKNFPHIVELFWKGLFTNPLFSDSAFLENELKQKSLPYSCSDTFLPVLLKLYPDSKLLRELDNSMIDFSFYNITSETLRDAFIYYESITTLQPCEYIIIIGNVPLNEVHQQFFDCFQILFNNLGSFLRCDVSCCVAPEVPMPELPHTIEKLRNMREDNISLVNLPLCLSDYTPQKTAYTPPSLDVISAFLEQKQASAALKNLEGYLDLLTKRKKINRDFLIHLRLDIEQLVFSYLQNNGIEAHILFGTKETGLLASKSPESVPYMIDYLRYIITRAVDYSSFIHEESSVTDIILNYIHQHYSEDITRTTLAEMVYLNPDYMARLFKKRTQTSVVNYITAYRMEKAKEFLQNQQISVGTVAARVGYGNYSYFSKLFKDVVGCTPNEYRKKSKK